MGPVVSRGGGAELSQIEAELSVGLAVCPLLYSIRDTKQKQIKTKTRRFKEGCMDSIHKAPQHLQNQNVKDCPGPILRRRT